MNRQTVTDGDMTYTIALDDGPAIGRRLWAVVQARLVDELTGMPVTTNTRVTPAGSAFTKPTAQAAVTPRVGSGGVVGLVGVPVSAFPALDTQTYQVGLNVTADGYVPVSATQPLGPIGGFPTNFAQADLGDLSLHRNPIVLRGRTVRRLSTGDTVALPGATVRVTGVWRTIPPANTVVAPLAPNLAALTPPLYTGRTSAATGAVHTVSVTETTGEDKQTLAANAVGDTTLRLSDHVNLAANDTIVIDSGNSGLREVVTITSITGPSSAIQPVTATLAYPLAVAHAQGAIVRKVSIATLGATDAIGTDATAGDTTVLLSAATTLAAPGFVSIDGGGAAGTEYHWLAPYVVTSDSDGYYRLPPLSRVAQLSLQAEQAPYTSVPQTISPNYALREQIVNLVVT